MKDDNIIITKWNALKPRKDLRRGYSCYYLKRGYKISKFIGHENNLLCWYCDIIDVVYIEKENSFIFKDLLLDVKILPDGLVKVLDLAELAEAVETSAITVLMATNALKKLDSLLSIIYSGNFSELTGNIEEVNHPTPCGGGL